VAEVPTIIEPCKNEEDKEKEWYAIYTRSRHEKIVDNDLTDKGVETFLPLREFVSQWKDRKKKIESPLFPGYLFTHINLVEDFRRIITTRGVVKIVGTNGTPVPIPKEQIDSVKALLKSSLKYDPYPYFSEGMEVLIISGPLQGVVGKVVEKRGKYRLLLSIDLIKRSVLVEVDAKDVEVL